MPRLSTVLWEKNKLWIPKQMLSSKTLVSISKKEKLKPFTSFLFHSSQYQYFSIRQSVYQHRLISSTTSLGSWMDSIKGVFTGKKKEDLKAGSESFTLLQFADELKKARKVGTFKNYIVGRSSEATFADAFGKMESIILYLSKLDPAGENIQTSQKQEAAQHCNCTIADVENALSKFTWAKEAQKKLEQLKEEGKPMPKSIAEVQKLMGSTPLDLARSNLAKSGQISRNALCPCGSKKRYKRCCGKDKAT